MKQKIKFLKLWIKELKQETKYYKDLEDEIMTSVYENRILCLNEFKDMIKKYDK